MERWEGEQEGSGEGECAWFEKILGGGGETGKGCLRGTWYDGAVFGLVPTRLALQSWVWFWHWFLS